MLPQRTRKPPVPPIPHTEDTIAAIVVAVLPSRISQDGREEPEKGGGPCSNGDAYCDDGGEKVNDYEHGGAVVG